MNGPRTRSRSPGSGDLGPSRQYQAAGGLSGALSRKSGRNGGERRAAELAAKPSYSAGGTTTTMSAAASGGRTDGSPNVTPSRGGSVSRLSAWGSSRRTATRAGSR
ncbi:hypothetical protein [Streptomyces dangxiongensis]|uniref:hypothetical protein n=1 Tax=Streptomyces dangxiongensis TaxID=1442032 RepID=UPI001F0903EB|nr:hypothetical protein [Streptomyces dangxiongensis]